MTTCVRIEGRRIDTKLASGEFGGDEELYRRRRATKGSALLRNAILLSMGLDPPVEARIIPEREVILIPEACPHCGAPAKPHALLIAHIQHTVAAYYGHNPRVMVSAQRGRDIAHPRQVAMFLAGELTPKSLPEIGRRFGGRDHTTVIHAIRAVRKRMATDPETLLDVEVLRERLAA